MNNEDLYRYLISNFEYKNGLLIRTKNSGKAKIGDELGSYSNGYLIANFKRKMYKVHRLIWIYHNGNIDDTKVIDHIDRNRLNNKIENLRLVSYQENSFNKETKGYCFDKQTGLYRAFISVNGKKINLGRFKTEEEASDAYKNAKQQYHLYSNKDTSLTYLLRDWRNSRNIIESNTQVYVENVIEELLEIYHKDKDTINYYKARIMADFFADKLPISTEDTLDAMQDIQVFSINEVELMGYDNLKCNDEVFKEINSRRQKPEQKKEWSLGIGLEQKWLKDLSQDKSTLYTADYSKCLK